MAGNFLADFHLSRFYLFFSWQNLVEKVVVMVRVTCLRAKLPIHYLVKKSRNSVTSVSIPHTRNVACSDLAVNLDSKSTLISKVLLKRFKSYVT